MLLTNRPLVSHAVLKTSHHGPFAKFAGLKSDVYRAHLKSDDVPQEDDSDDICIRGNEDTLHYDVHTVLDNSMLDADINRCLQFIYNEQNESQLCL
uniref:Uncharacterized protein n=1 Tax=Amphimedon queenslandica TaxID=400682 RepID=A0A1X7V121_AMPQE